MIAAQNFDMAPYSFDGKGPVDSVAYPIYSEGTLSDVGESAFGTSFSDAVTNVINSDANRRLVLLSFDQYPVLIWSAGSSENTFVANDPQIALALKAELDGRDLGTNTGIHADLEMHNGSLLMHVHAPTIAATGRFLQFMLTNAPQLASANLASLTIATSEQFAEIDTPAGKQTIVTREMAPIFRENVRLVQIMHEKQVLQLLGVIY